MRYEWMILEWVEIDWYIRLLMSKWVICYGLICWGNFEYEMNFIWLTYCVWLGNEFNYLNDWLEIGNPKDEMKNEWFMIEQQELF